MEPGANLTALVVDDEFLIAIELEETLRTSGFDVLTAVTLPEARDLLERQKVDVAVLDFRLGADAAELADVLRASGTPFLFCTGSLREEVHAVFPGAPVIGKPFSETELLAAIRGLTAPA